MSFCLFRILSYISFLIVFSIEALAIPVISFEETRYDFGDIEQGQKISHIFEFENSGDSELLIQKLSSTCGCTASVISATFLLPGEKGQIEIEIDTRYLKGLIEETVFIYSNNRENPVIRLTLLANVKDVFHIKKKSANAIFNYPCSGCHVNKGIGKRGKKLFFADCIMCHRKNAIASSLSEIKKLSRQELKKAINEGVTATVMPPFLNEFGGPLRKDKVESLIEYIKEPRF